MKPEAKVKALALETPGAAMDETVISTPFGTVAISKGGRQVTFSLYSDVRQSRHNVALFGYVQQLIKGGVTRFNTDHLRIVGRDRSLSLTRGKAKLDLVYYRRGKVYECELKTSREIGLDVTAIQLTELCRHVDDLTLLVPRGRLEEADTIAKLINLRHQITIEAYDGAGEDEDEE
ncbi:hypothetical protein ES708_05528 [subsurface metagenome]